MPYLTLIPQNKEEVYNIRREENFWVLDNIETELDTGDLILFVFGLHYTGDNVPRGFPFLDTYEGVSIEIDEIRRAEIRSIPDDGKFEVSFKDAVEELSGDQLDSDILEAIRNCARGQEFVEIDIGKFFKFTK